jgi:hypothetical protein
VKETERKRYEFKKENDPQEVVKEGKKQRDFQETETILSETERNREKEGKEEIRKEKGKS